MRIGIDIRSLIETHPSGVSHYTRELLQHLPLIGGGHEFRLFCNSAAEVPGWLTTLIARYPQYHLVHRRMPNKLFNLMQWAMGLPAVDRLAGTVDVFLMPNIIFAGISRMTPLVITAHDASFTYPGFYQLRSRWWHRVVNPGRWYRRADHILAVSESTRRDLVMHFGIPEQKVSVVHLGVDMARFQSVAATQIEQVRSSFRLDRPYVLFMGTVMDRKNIDTILQAWRALTGPGDGGYDLVLAGYIQEARLIPDDDRIRALGYIPEPLKPALYAGATAFVYPSFFEGFGLPVLEAMASGVPVITSAATSLGEVSGDAALLVNPYRADELADALRVVLRDQALRDMLIRRGRERASLFSWERTARETLAVLRAQGTRS